MRFDLHNGNSIQALKDVSLEIDEGQIGNINLTMDNEGPVAGFQFSLTASSEISEI